MQHNIAAQFCIKQRALERSFVAASQCLYQNVCGEDAQAVVNVAHHIAQRHTRVVFRGAHFHFLVQVHNGFLQCERVGFALDCCNSRPVRSTICGSTRASRFRNLFFRTPASSRTRASRFRTQRFRSRIASCNCGSIFHAQIILVQKLQEVAHIHVSI